MGECLKACVQAGGWGQIIGPVSAILGALLPSIITGMTRMPVKPGVGAKVMAVMDILSILTHKDSEGTIKAPIKRSKKRERTGKTPPPVSA